MNLILTIWLITIIYLQINLPSMNWLQLFFPTILLIVEMSKDEDLLLPTDVDAEEVIKKHLNDLNHPL